MRKVFVLSVLLVNGGFAFCQNMGIGTTSPETRLHITGVTDTSLLTLESPVALGVGRSVGMLLKSGGFYTAGIRTVGTSATSARLAFYTMAPGYGPAEMQERVSISHDGNMGIGYTSPAYKLAVNGTGYFYNNGSVQPDVPALKGQSAASSRFSPGVAGTGTLMGVVGNSNTTDGIGILGYNNAGNVAIPYSVGAGLQGFSSAGDGVVGITTKSDYSAVLGSTSAQGAMAGQFLASDVALALRTVGRLRFTGIGEAAGKVLTSDANGTASWQTPGGGGASVDKNSFSAYLSTSMPAEMGVNYFLSGLTTEYQLGEGFNSEEGLFIAPADGIYQFTFRIGFWVTGTNPIYSTVAIRKNGVTAIGGEFNHTTPGSNNTWYQSLNYTKTMLLSVGENVGIRYKLTQAGGSPITISGDGTPNTSFFSGVRLQ